MNILGKKAEEIIELRAKSLNDLGKFYVDACRSIDENPFIQKRWGIIDRLFWIFWIGYSPRTPAEQMKDALKKEIKIQAEEIEKNTSKLLVTLKDYYEK